MNKYLDIAKKNLASLICGVIALAGIIAIFYPIRGYFAELQTKADGRKASYTAMKGVLDKERHLPVVSIEGSAQGEPLKMFPTPAVAEVGAALVEKIKVQAAEMLKAAVNINVHTQLVANALPNGSPEPAGKFKRDYDHIFDFMSDATRNDSFAFKIMKAGFPPTDAQINDTKKRETDAINAKKAFAGNTVLNQNQIDAELADRIPKVADELKQAAAKNCLVYVEPAAFHQYQGFSTLHPGDFPTPGMLFNAQAGLWVQEDICRAIAEANKDAGDVTASAVKHLIKIDLADELFKQTAAAVSADPAAPAAAAGSSDPSQPLTPNFTNSLTGRTSNGLYDVINFTLKLDVEAAQLPKVLRAISDNKFLSVLNCSVNEVDLALLNASGFYYGNKPVVTLDLQCEELLLRDWTVPLMPLNVRQAMGVAAPTAAPAAAPAAAG